MVEYDPQAQSSVNRPIIIAAIIVCIALTMPVFAQFITTQQIGDYTFASGTDADGNWVNGSSVRIGDMIFHDYSTANGGWANGSTINIGNIAFHDFSTPNGNAISGTSQFIGDMGFHNFSDLNGNMFNGTSTIISNTRFNEMNVFEQNRFLEGIPTSILKNDKCKSYFTPARFTFGETTSSQYPVFSPKSNYSDLNPRIQMFDQNTNKITAAGVLIQPNTRVENCISGPTLDELYARAADAVKNKHFVMIAHVEGIYNNTHRVLLDTCDTITFSASEFKKIRDKWKAGDLVSISEWIDDNGDFVDYELEVYGKPSARGEVIDEWHA